MIYKGFFSLHRKVSKPLSFSFICHTVVYFVNVGTTFPKVGKYVIGCVLRIFQIAYMKGCQAPLVAIRPGK